MDIEIRDLRLITTIAQTGSLTNAANLLHLTQSTLSHHLAELENRINKPLFYRSGRRLTLTPVGDRFRIAAEPILERMNLMQHELANDGSETHSELRFATECYTTYPWFGRIAREFKSKCPNVELRLITEATARPLPELERGSIDIAITSSRIRNKKLCVQDLFSDELVAVVAKDHPWAEAKEIAIKEFRHIHLLAYSASPMDSDFVREILIPAGVVPLKVSGIQLTEALLEFARACLGVAVVARWTVGNLSKSGELVAIRIGQNGLHRNWKAVWMRNHPKPEILMTFAKMLSFGQGPRKKIKV
jgi:LysR family transcriptional regulator, regulator for metE and metH